MNTWSVKTFLCISNAKTGTYQHSNMTNTFPKFDEKKEKTSGECLKAHFKLCDYFKPNA